MKLLSRFFFLVVPLLTVMSVSSAAEVTWNVSAVSNVGGDGTIDQWGKSHYEKFGNAEGRTLPASGNYGDYVRQYPDLLAAYDASTDNSTGASTSGGGISQAIDQWGKSHYEKFGNAEGRTLPASGNYGDYVRQYPDLSAAYNKSDSGITGGEAGITAPAAIAAYVGAGPQVTWDLSAVSSFKVTPTADGGYRAYDIKTGSTTRVWPTGGGNYGAYNNKASSFTRVRPTAGGGYSSFNATTRQICKSRLLSNGRVLVNCW